MGEEQSQQRQQREVSEAGFEGISHEKTRRLAHDPFQELWQNGLDAVQSKGTTDS
jgi:hypothetical protein